MTNSSKLGLQLHGSRCVLSHTSVGARLPRMIHDFAVAGWHSMMQDMLGGPFTLHELWFTHERPPDTEPYERYFPDVPLRFGMPMDALVFDTDLRHAPLRTADPVLVNLLDRQLTSSLPGQRPTGTFETLVRDTLSRVLVGQPHSASLVAKQLAVSERTLARRLSSEGRTFKQVVDDTRHDLAYGLLTATEMGLAEIAWQLGFSEASAFSRAFRRWTGTSPGAWRVAPGRRIAR